MLWLNRFHDDHMALVRVLPKLEGNLKDIEYGEAGPNVAWELREFAELVRNVVIPHFKEEERIVYPKASGVSDEGHKFILSMYEEHNTLYEAFDGFFKALGGDPGKGEWPKQGNKPSQLISISENINKHEVPKNIDKVVPPESLNGKINKEELLRHGYNIVQMLKEHIEKEETTVAELISKANETEQA